MERRLSWDEYLAYDDATDERHEYVDGYVLPMGGATPAHARLAARLTALFDAALDGKPCGAYAGSLRVWMPAIHTARYPTLSVLRDRADEDDATFATTRPTVLVEIDSPTPHRASTREKFDDHVSIPTLEDYVVVSTTTRVVTHWHRDGSGRWLGIRLGPDDTLDLASVDVRIPLAEVYEEVDLDEAPRFRVERKR